MQRGKRKIKHFLLKPISRQLTRAEKRKAAREEKKAKDNTK